MSMSTSINYVLWVAAGGAVGAMVHYLAVTVAGPRISAGRVALLLNSCACLLLGIAAASSRSWHGYAFFAVGMLGSVAPFTAVAGQVLDRPCPRPRRRTMLLAIGTVGAGVSMAVVGYILADVGSITIEKVPGSRH